jgi:hypothetical protein
LLDAARHADDTVSDVGIALSVREEDIAPAASSGDLSSLLDLQQIYRPYRIGSV